MNLKVDDGWVKVWEHEGRVGVATKYAASIASSDPRGAVYVTEGPKDSDTWHGCTWGDSFEQVELWLRVHWGVAEEVTAEHVGRMVMAWDGDPSHPIRGELLMVEKRSVSPYVVLDVRKRVLGWKYARLATEEDIARG